MNVYRVHLNCNPYKSLSVDRREYESDEDYEHARRNLAFRAEPKEPWVPPKMYFREPKKPDPDFWTLEVLAEAFAVGPNAAETIFPFLEMAGQILPLRVKDKELLICNVLQVYDCIDPKRSEWRMLMDGKSRGSLLTPYFVPEHFHSSTLFKIPEQWHTIYCWEETRDIEEEFKACVEKHKFKGLSFVLVWSDEKQNK